MRGAIRERGRAVLFAFPDLLARLGIVDRERARRTFDLAVPEMVSGGIYTVLRAMDFFMVSIALTDAAVAALELAFQYFFVGFGLAIALSSGTISVVSRFKGAGDHAEADFAVKQSLWLSLLLAAPMTAIAWVYAEPLLAVLTNDPRTIELGAIYLRIVMLVVALRFWSMIASRALAGTGDTRTPMKVNLLVVPTNLVLNAVLIFGLGPFPRLGIAGAAWGTAIASSLGAAIFLGLLLSGRFDVRLRLGGKQWDTGIAWEIVRVGSPLAGMRLAQTFGRFPFLFVLATLGTPVVAAFAIGRRVIMLAMMPGWGYSTAASTLVGQAIGADDEADATAYGWATLRIALATQLVIAAAIVVLADPLVALFNTGSPALTVNFVRVFALGIAGFSVARTMQGSLRGAGDTSWPFYGTMLGTGLRIAVAAVALPTGFAVASLAGVAVAPGLGLGTLAVFAAILLDWYARAVVNTVRFRSGAWKAIARRSAAGQGTPGD